MSNAEIRMQAQMSNDQRAQGPHYDLEERTARFGEATIGFAKRVPRDPITEPLIPQLVRAGTSIGANDCEADDAGAKKEFRYRISICKHPNGRRKQERIGKKPKS